MTGIKSKNCRICNKIKDISRFSWRNDSKNYRTECKDCLNKKRKNQHRYGMWYKENLEKVREHNKRSGLKTRYGLSLEEYNKIKKEQNNRCKICNTTKPNNHGQFCVDHCHKTGKIRGLLCDKCNRGLGYFNDDFITLNSAVIYLEESIDET